MNEQTWEKAESSGSMAAAALTEAKLDELIRLQKNTLAGSWIRTGLVILFAAAAVVFAVIAICEFRTVDRVIQTIKTDVEALEMDEVNEAVSSLTAAADRIGKLDMDAFNTAIGDFSTAVSQLEKLDMDALNKTVDRTGDLVGTVNGLVSDLKSVTDVLKNVAETLKNLFCW